MAVQINPNTLAATGQADRLTALGQIGQADARNLLRELRTDLARKPGVLRLMHTSSANQALTFQRANGFKQAFLRGDKLQRAGDSVKDLLRQAGLPADQVAAFDTYVQARGKSGVSTKEVLRYIDSFMPMRAPDQPSALRQLGISPPGPGQLLGSGAFGQAFKVDYRGQPCVLKLFHGHEGDSANAQLHVQEGRRILVREEHQTDSQVLDLMAKRQAQVGPDSFVHMQSEVEPSQAHSPLPPDFLKSAAAGNSYYNPKASFDHLSSAQDDMLDLYGAKDDFLAQVALKDVKAQPSPPLGVGLPQAMFESSEPELEPHQEPMAHASPAEQAVRPSVFAAGLILEDEVRPDRPEQPEPPVAQAGLRLGRTDASNAVRLKNMPGVIAPSVLLVREFEPDGQQTVHIVPGGAAFKAWARTRAPLADLVVDGILMPLAPGKPLLARSSAIGADDRSNVNSRDLHLLASQGLAMIKRLQARGFVHGDIKPDNLVMSAQEGTVNLIDTDGLRKISKNPDRQIPRDQGVASLTYLHPLARAKQACGAGRDLYAFGMTLLETSLLASGQNRTWTRWENTLAADYSGMKANSLDRRAEARVHLAQQVRNANFDPDSAEHFAMQCIAQALDYEEGRLGQKTNTTFERYTEGNAQHPLNVLSAHPFLNA